MGGLAVLAAEQGLSRIEQWLGIAFLCVAMPSLIYFVSLLPKVLRLQRENCARQVELLESIDRRLAEQSKERR